MKQLVFYIFAALLLGCSNMEIMDEEKTAADGTVMQSVKHSGFAEFHVAKDSDIQAYQKIQYAPLGMDTLNIDQRRISLQDRNWQLTEENKRNIAKLFSERVQAFYEKKREFALVNTSNENTLNVTFELLEFLPTASQDSGVARAARSDIFTRGIGKLHARAIISDAQTGRTIATLEENREVGDTRIEENNRSTNIRKIRLHFDSWISRLDAMLGKL